jgi:hypothetical protein
VASSVAFCAKAGAVLKAMVNASRVKIGLRLIFMSGSVLSWVCGGDVRPCRTAPPCNLVSESFLLRDLNVHTALTTMHAVRASHQLTMSDDDMTEKFQP